jgi:hypothetical protein
VFDNRDFGGEQKGMHGPAQVAGVINVQRVDADERHASVEKVLGGVFRQEGVALEILVRAPVRIPAGADQDRLASQIVVFESCTTDGPAFRQVRRNHDAFQICQSV